MQAHQVITGVFIFVVTAGTFLYIGVATYYYRTKVIEKEKVGESKKMPSPIGEPKEKDLLEPLKKPPDSSSREEHPLDYKSEGVSQCEGTCPDLSEESATKESHEDLSSQSPSLDLSPSSIETSEEEEIKIPETLYIHSCEESQTVLDNLLLSEKVPPKDKLIRIFFGIKLKCRDQVPESISEYIKDLYERKIGEFIEQTEDNQKLITASDKIKLLFRKFQIEPRSMREDICFYLKSELEVLLKHSETGGGQKGSKEEFQIYSKAFSAYCTQT